MRLSDIRNAEDASLQQWAMHSGTCGHLFIKSKCFLGTNNKGQVLFAFSHTAVCSSRLLSAAPVSVVQQRATKLALKLFKTAGHCRHCRWYSTREQSIRSKGHNLLKKARIKKMHCFQMWIHSHIYYNKKANFIKHLSGFHVKDLSETLLPLKSPSFTEFQEVFSFSSFPESTHIDAVYSRSDGTNSVQLQCMMGGFRTGHTTEYKRTPQTA